MLTFCGEKMTRAVSRHLITDHDVGTRKLHEQRSLLCASSAPQPPPSLSHVSTTYLANGRNPLAVGVRANTTGEPISVVFGSLHHILLESVRVVGS